MTYIPQPDLAPSRNPTHPRFRSKEQILNAKTAMWHSQARLVSDGPSWRKRRQSSKRLALLVSRTEGGATYRQAMRNIRERRKEAA